MSKLFAKRQVKTAFCARNGLRTSDVRKIPLGSSILMYNTCSDRWEGPFTLVHVEGEVPTVLLPHGSTIFGSTSVRRYDTTKSRSSVSTYSANTASVPAYLSQTKKEPSAGLDSGTLNREARSINFHRLFQLKKNARFAVSRKGSSMSKQMFTVIPKSAADGKRVYGSRYVDQTKNEGQPDAFEKSRLVALVFKATDHGLLTHAPTVQPTSFCLFLTIFALDPALSFHS